MFVGLNDPPDENNLHWIDFGTRLVLREVIIGAPMLESLEQDGGRRGQILQRRRGLLVGRHASRRFSAGQTTRPPWWHAEVK